MQTSPAKSTLWFRRAAPWLLFGVWLTASAAQLWSMEVESLRAGIVCTTTFPSDSKITTWIQDWLR
ncbi:MAG TPA: hypothetical protein VFF03_06190 [Rhodocyclaceae bacterium]|nr:hypothetical protein [Rhodocyclaceae bacterium]